MRQKIRCAICTRQSSDDGLEQEFESLDAQREACSPSLSLSTAFQLKRCGVETKVVLGNHQPAVNILLIRNIAKAVEWYEAVKIGKSYAEISAQTGTPKHRIQKAICLAFLAPDIVQQATEGTLPLHITSDFLIRHGVPAEWNEQREMLADTAVA